MGKVAVDVLMVVSYDFSDFSKTCIYTNAREEALEELFSNWIQDQMFKGADTTKLEEHDAYVIKIGLVIEDDSFCTESNTGNKGLTAGIIIDVLRKLKTIPVKTLADRPPHVLEAVTT